MEEYQKKSSGQAVLTIHRAASQIGGNCVEIAAGDVRVLFDFGLPLASIKEGKPPRAYRVPVPGVYKNETPSVNAVFLTHAHPDHYGLLCELNPQIPVYASQTTVQLLQQVAPLLGYESLKHFHFIVLRPRQQIVLGGLRIQAAAVDHSVPEAFAYQITLPNGKKVLYTGDLRSHGNCAYLTRRLARSHAGPDYLLMEGTSLGRGEKRNSTENTLRRVLQKSFSTERMPVIYFSAQNLDRFISVYKAARAMKKELVIDPYSCYILEQFAHLGKNIPQWNWRGIRVYFVANSLTKKLGVRRFRYKTKKILLEEIVRCPQKYIVKDNFVLRQKILQKMQQVSFIHSAWAGYLDEPDSTFKQDAQKYGLPLLQVHTSGHADVPSLQQFVERVRPRLLIPIHTNQKQDYPALFDAPVKILRDGEPFEL